MDDSSIYEDEFEEFRVRANSGGTLPETWRRKQEEARRKRHGDTCPWSSKEHYLNIRGEQETIERLKYSLHKLDLDLGDENPYLDEEDYFMRPHSLPASSKLPRRAERLGMAPRCNHRHLQHSNEELHDQMPMRPRSCTVPHKIASDNGSPRKSKPMFDFCRVCSFKITSKGIIKGKDRLMIKSEENLTSPSPPPRRPSPLPVRHFYSQTATVLYTLACTLCLSLYFWLRGCSEIKTIGNISHCVGSLSPF